MPQRQCTATTKAGSRCWAPALPNDDLCFSHSPAVAAERAERNRRGGRNKDGTVRAAKSWVAAGKTMRTEDMPALLLGMTEAVAMGELEPARASAIARLVRTALEVSIHVTWERRLGGLEASIARIEPAKSFEIHEGNRQS